jgi:hypothetical protein
MAVKRDKIKRNTQNQVQAALRQRIGRVAINAFIVFHLIVIICAALPIDPAPIVEIRGLLWPYVLWTGLFQRWDMFAPDPPTINSYIKAVVIDQDRHIHVWPFPRMEELPLGERFQKERYRKFADVLPQPQMAPLWPYVARRIAGQFDGQAGALDKVMLIDFQSEITPGVATEQPFRPTIFYEDYVHPETRP